MTARLEATTLTLSGEVLTGDREPHIVAWTNRIHRPRRTILVPPGREGERLLPMKRENRARILAAIAKGRSWMQGLVSGRIPDTAATAAREKLTERAVRMTLSLAHLDPSIVRAIVDARLPRGIGPRHLCELPASWAEQERILGI